MSSYYKNITSSTLVQTGPGSVDKVIINSNSGGSFRLFDAVADGAATPITGTFTPTTATSSEVDIEATFATGLYVAVGGTANITVMINGDSLR